MRVINSVVWQSSGKVCVYLACAGGAWCIGVAPRGAAEARDAVGVVTRLPGVRGLIVVGAGVRNATRTTLPLQHGRAITQQDRTWERYTSHLSLLHPQERERERESDAHGMKWSKCRHLKCFSFGTCWDKNDWTGLIQEKQKLFFKCFWLENKVSRLPALVSHCCVIGRYAVLQT